MNIPIIRASHISILSWNCERHTTDLVESRVIKRPVWERSETGLTSSETDVIINQFSI